MAGIAGYTIAWWDESTPLQIAGITPKLRYRPGVDFADVQDIGIQPQPFTARAIVYSASAAATTLLMNNLVSAQGSIVAGVDNYGRSAYYLIHRVQLVSEDAFSGAAGLTSSTGARVVFAIEMTPYSYGWS